MAGARRACARHAAMEAPPRGGCRHCVACLSAYGRPTAYALGGIANAWPGGVPDAATWVADRSGKGGLGGVTGGSYEAAAAVVPTALRARRARNGTLRDAAPLARLAVPVARTGVAAAEVERFGPPSRPPPPPPQPTVEDATPAPGPSRKAERDLAPEEAEVEARLLTPTSAEEAAVARARVSRRAVWAAATNAAGVALGCVWLMRGADLASIAVVSTGGALLGAALGGTVCVVACV